MQLSLTKSLSSSASTATPTTGVASHTNLASHRIGIPISLVLAIVVVTIFCQPLTAQTSVSQSKQTEADPATIQRAISQLGDPAPFVRRNAQQELRNFGAAAIEELEKAAKFETTVDYETQIAATKILELIREKVAIEETDKFVRGETDKFVLEETDKFNRGETLLLGWQAFKKFTGDTPESRSLYRDIYLKNRSELTKALRPTANNAVSYGQLLKLFESPKLEQVCLGMFLLASQQQQQNAAQGDAELPFLHERPSEQQLSHLLSSCARQSSPLTNLRTNIEPVALLIRAVLETAPKEHPIYYRKLSVIQQIKSPVIGPLVVEFAAPENPTVVRALAIAHAIKIGDAEIFNQLNTYLNDDTVVGKFLAANTVEAQETTNDDPASQLINEVQIRDIVLLGNLQLAGKTPTDFGFSSDAINAGGNKVDIKRTGFSNDQDRKQAFERYQSLNGQ